ncbi:MAG: arylesterase [Bacteroidetes bacterium]|nr:arylesterase [Bacteroidota bacterium]
MLLSFIIFITSLACMIPQDSRKTIIFYGNSLTAGYGLAPENAFPAVVAELIEESGKKYKVVNAGVSGETSSGGLTRIDWILKQHIDIFILELGANDGLRGIPTKKTIENLLGIIDKLKSTYPDCKIIIAGMMVPPNMGQDYANKFAGIYSEIVKSTNAAFIPFLLEGVAGDPDLNLPDGIHPNSEGHKIVAKNVMAVLEPFL